MNSNDFDRRHYGAIALVSLAVILLEIAFTRVLSVVLWYHWAFMSISLAMLGLGVPGVWFSLVKSPARWLRPLLLASAVLIPASVIAILQAGHILRQNAVLLAMTCILLPMLALGGAICVLLIEARGARIGRMYGFDLLGGCVGALIIVPLLWTLPTPALIGAIGALPLLAHMLISKRWYVSASGLLVIVTLVAWGKPFELHFSKSYVETATRKPVYERWTPTARLTFFDSVFWVPDKKRGFAWGRGSKARRIPVKQHWIEQDSCAGTPVTNYRGNPAEVAFLMDDVTTVGYQLRPPAKVAIIGAGGGRDILSALHVGAKEIDAVELNGGIVEALSTRFKQFSGDVYHQPGVNAIVSEGRSFLTRTKKTYDFIQISLIDSWAATSAGAFALSENNLYTREAYRTYFQRLTKGGILSTSRWMKGHHSIELPRLLELTLTALKEEGIADPNKHIAVVQGSRVATVIVSKSPILKAETEKLIGLSQRRGFQLHHPRTRIAPAGSVVREILDKGVGRWTRQGFDMSPPVDDKPFFFLTFSPLKLLSEGTVQRYGPNSKAVFALQRLILYTSIVTLILFFFPFVLGRWFKRQPGFGRGSAFFALIGISFMLVEIPWVQRFILYLGHPSYATTVVLASVLLGAGLGAMASTRLGLAKVQRFGLLLPLAVVAVNAGLGVLFSTTLGAPLALRVVLSFLAIAPVAFVMGFLFPAGMLRFGDGNKPWFWAMNGAFSVFASVSSLALSMAFGFTTVAYFGAGFYVLALVVLQGKPAVGAAG